jgi:uncharacterized protein YecE (DUF72 family)
LTRALRGIAGSDLWMSMRIKIGLCGFTIGMAAYAKRFPVLEVQQTFYQPPAAATMSRWRQTMPPSFEFTVKAWQLITHAHNSSTYRRLKRPLNQDERATVGSFQASAIVDEGWAVTLECAKILGATAILFQCPASFRPVAGNLQNMREFFKRIGRPPGIRLLWEPRGPWPEDVLRKICSDLDLVHVVDPFARPTVTNGYTYYRLHGTTGARHVYSDAELQRLTELIPAQGDTYIMFNNMPRVIDSRRFVTLLVSAGTLGPREARTYLAVDSR